MIIKLWLTTIDIYYIIVDSINGIMEKIIKKRKKSLLEINYLIVIIFRLMKKYCWQQCADTVNQIIRNYLELFGILASIFYCFQQF